MFKNKKFLLVFIIETIVPWIVAVLGFITICFFDDEGEYYRLKMMDEYEHAKGLFRAFFSYTMLAGGVILFLLTIAGIVAFIFMIIHMVKSEKEKYSIARPLIIGVWSGLCSVGTVILMLLTMAFTYGMSV